jgi:membrane-associated phospholipid phosphatase
MKRFAGVFFLLAAMAGCISTAVRADEVTDWNGIMLQAAHDAVPPTSPLVMTRVAAIVQASVFDSVNGIERRYTPIHVAPAAPRGASRRAAVVQAAYASLVRLYPSQKSTFDTKLAESLAAIADGEAEEHSESIARGVEWGQAVADAIWAWRSTDGFTPAPPPFLGGPAVGQWRPTPPGFLPGAAPQFATMAPWVIESPSQFRPAGPPDLASARYAADFNETKSMGSFSSALRSADQTLAARFWASTTANYLWNHVALELGDRRHLTLSENARLLALLNLAMADAGIACWDAKYQYVFWRPVTAIPLADTDGNPATDADPAWAPFLVTPNHPEYPSGHSTVSGAAAGVLAAFFGGGADFTMNSDFMPGVVRSFGNFAAALDDVAEARIFAGIHYRSACRDGLTTGDDVAEYVLEHALRRVHGDDDGRDR